MAGRIRKAFINPSPGNRERVTGKLAVASVHGGTIVKISNDQDIGLILSHTGFEPTLQLARIVGRTQVCIPHTASDLKPTELVY